MSKVLKIGEHEVFYPASAEEKISAHQWKIQKGNSIVKGGEEKMLYAFTKIRSKKVFMHRMLYPKLLTVHHIDRNGLNNMPENIQHKNVVAWQPPSLKKYITWDERKTRFQVKVPLKTGRKRSVKYFSVKKYKTREKAVSEAVKWKNLELKK